MRSKAFEPSRWLARLNRTFVNARADVLVVACTSSSVLSCSAPCRARLECRSASLAQVRLALSQAAFDLVGVRDLAAAIPERVRGACCPLFGRASIVRTIVLCHCRRFADAGGGQDGHGDTESQHAHRVLFSFRCGPPTCQTCSRLAVGIITFEPRHGELGLGKSDDSCMKYTVSFIKK